VFEVLGKGTITVIDPGNLSYTNYTKTDETAPLSLHQLTIHVLSHGDRYDYQRRRVVGRE
jgi:cyanophycinase